MDLEIGSGLGRQQRGDHAGRHEGGHAEIGGAPSEGVGEVERPGASDEIADAPADLRPGGHESLPLFGRDRDAPTVDHDILRRAGDTEREAEANRPCKPVGRIAKGDARQRQHDANLRDDDPAAPPSQETAEYRRVIAVEEGRPQEFELVGQRQFAHQPQHGDRHLGLRQPRRLRHINEHEGNARTEAEAQHGGDAAIGKKMAEGDFCMRGGRHARAPLSIT